jgi:diphthamide biosynthesis protein 2
MTLAHYLEVTGWIKKALKIAQKKYYSFVVGKINMCKLANFAEIDVFVLVACPENSLLDSKVTFIHLSIRRTISYCVCFDNPSSFCLKEYYKPIVTPFELALALVE